MVKIGIPSEDVIAMLTQTPAREIGADRSKAGWQPAMMRI